MKFFYLITYYIFLTMYK